MFASRREDGDLQSWLQSLCQGNDACLARFLQLPQAGWSPRTRDDGDEICGYLVPLVSAAGLTLLSGCNTVEGVGRDLERAGDAIQDEADDTRDRRRRDD